MSFCKTRSVRHGVVVIWIFGALLSPICAQTETPSSDVAETAIKIRLTETRRLLEQDKDDAADTRIAAGAQSKPQSAEWHQEKAMDFLRIAFSAQEMGDARLAQKAARRALAQLDKAQVLSAGDLETMSSISELRGIIRERLLGTTEEAVTEYKKALERKADSTSARQKLNQLVRPISSKKQTAKK
jgi:hypothetical protein